MLAAIAVPRAPELSLERIDTPVAGAGDVVVQVASAGITPGLLQWWKMGRMPLERYVLGHEIAGTISEVGAGVTAYAAGDRVRVHANLTCRSCEHCLDDREQMCESCGMIGGGAFGPRSRELLERYPDGGLAQYVRVPAWLLDPLADAVSFDAAAKAHDLASCLRALKLAELRPGSTLVVTAATGAMGAAMAKMAPLMGIARLILVARSRERADGVAALCEAPTEVIALEELDGWQDAGGLTDALRALAPGGVDAIIDYLTENPGLRQAMGALRVGGSAVTMAPNRMPLDLSAFDLMHNCWRLVGTRNGTRGDARQVLDLLAAGRVDADALITHRFPLTEVAEAVRVVRERPLPTWMTVVNP